MIPIEAITTIGGLVLPPVFDLIKKVFVKKGADTPEATMSSLATTKPEVLPQYVEAVTNLRNAETSWFNRDIVGQASTWVVDLRAVIRPMTVVASMLLLGLDAGGAIALEPGARASFLFIVGTWFGGRLTLGGN